MADHDEQQVYADLKSFLLSDRTDLRKAAADAVHQQLQNASDKIVKFDLIPALASCISFDNNAVSIKAMESLVYLTSSEMVSNQATVDLLEARGIARLLEVTLSKSENTDEWRKCVNLACSLLANLTRSEVGAVDFCGKSMPDEAVKQITDEPKSLPSMDLLLHRFLNPAFQDKDESTNWKKLLEEGNLDTFHRDPYQHVAAVLMNACQVEAGRRFVTRLNDNESVLQRLLSQLRHVNPIRRRGIAGLTRNVCLDTDNAWWLLNVVKIAKHLMYPLAGPEELDIDERRGLDPDLWMEGPDKEREVDQWTRLYLVECILLLCASGRESRKVLRLERVYVVLKWADMVESSEDVSEKIFECVNFLRRDEEGTMEGSSDKMVEQAYLPRIAAGPAVSVQNLDDVD